MTSVRARPRRRRARQGGAGSSIASEQYATDKNSNVQNMKWFLASISLSAGGAFRENNPPKGLFLTLS